MSELVVGIDLGTTNSCIAVERNGKIEVIPNREGNRTTLSYVYYGEDSILVGKTAKYMASANPSNGIYEIKRLIGCLHDDPDIESERKSLNYELVRGTNGEILIQVEQNSEKFHTLPEEVCARILHRLKIDAEMYLGQKVSKAVVTVPAYFNNNQRAATRDAARIAGFEVLKLVNEPSAAALAYVRENRIKNGRVILIYDLGGGTFDVSIVRTENGTIKVLSVDGDTHLGGQDFLNRLVDHVVDYVQTKHGIKVRENKRLMMNILNSCEKTKKILTSANRTVIPLEFSGHFDQLEVTREQFEELNRDLFAKTVKILDNCIRNRRMSKEEIDEVLLVGGSSRIPRIETLLKAYFDKPIQRNINADEAIAIGAALEAHHFAQTHHNSLLIDVLPLSIGTVFDEETIFFNFARNTPLPANSKHVHVFKNRKQKNCILSVYEGGHLDCNKNVLLGAHEIKWTATTKKNRNVEITMQINNYGIIWVTARGESIKTFSIALNKGRLEDDEIRKLSRGLQVS
ncbi:heat shock 70 kDa protein II [Tribolium castaneum]|uniref:Heat shock 70 kDa protein cognate 1-like Protein n=1 Tax=Tribolium castaneum TaxID=7070 RepID=D6WVR7_TRICA|nr:PREDICTED: heat shock 70 kDa protein II [Tribolium castaneum]EFA08256.1 Heat shock 70 kDa protein cognate 1-like Protein [Tribolium castaneum]|eukprot:XP_968075.2 PREDICTED: heat shock 70 kDa protein II [Tribolium castaneum]